MIAFRPQNVSIHQGKQLNKLVGNIEEVLYSGSKVRLRIRLTNDELIVMKEPISFGRGKFDVGEEITMMISPKDILIYPYPQEGVDKELALE
jgi:hypothetical protein